jgi:cobalt-zinc-cadmium efflux system outer membrane protein
MTIPWSRALGACAVLCVLAGWKGTAYAAAPGALTLAEAIERASARNPALAAFTPELLGARVRADIEALRPVDTIESDLENFAGSGNFSGADSLEATVRYSRTFELGEKAALRRDVGMAEWSRLSNEHTLRKIDVAAEVARRFIHVLSDQETLNAARRAGEIARRARDAVRARVDAGAASPMALSKAEIAVARSHIEEEHAEHELASSRVKLAVMWGERDAGFSEASGDLFRVSELQTLDAYQARLDASPELTRFASDTQLQDARMRLADARRSPDVSVSAGVRRLEAFDDQALVASFSVPLGTRRRAELERRSVQADRDRIDIERQARLLELRATLFELYQELQHARTETQALHEQVRPQASSMLQAAEQGYRAGRFSLIELTDAQTQLLQIERDVIRAAGEFHALLVELRRLLGEPINTLEIGRSP